MKTGMTISRNQAIGALLDKNIVVIPFTVDHFGSIGDRGNHFLAGFSDNPPSPLNIDHALFPNAVLMDDLIRSGNAPMGLLYQASRVWRSSLLN